MRAKRPSHARVPTDLCCIDKIMCDVQLSTRPAILPILAEHGADGAAWRSLARRLLC